MEIFKFSYSAVITAVIFVIIVLNQYHALLVTEHFILFSIKLRSLSSFTGALGI